MGVNDFAFDGILFIQSLHHINPLDQSLAQAARLLDKGGFVLVDDFAFNQDRRKGRRLVADMLVVRALKISQMIRQLPDGTPPTYDSMH